MESRRAKTPWHKRFGLTASRTYPVHGDKDLIRDFFADEPADGRTLELPEPTAHGEPYGRRWRDPRTLVSLAVVLTLVILAVLGLQMVNASPPSGVRLKPPSPENKGSESPRDGLTQGPRIASTGEGGPGSQRPSESRTEPHGGQPRTIHETVRVTVTAYRPTPVPGPTVTIYRPTPAPGPTVTVTQTVTPPVLPFAVPTQSPTARPSGR